MTILVSIILFVDFEVGVHSVHTVRTVYHVQTVGFHRCPVDIDSDHDRCWRRDGVRP